MNFARGSYGNGDYYTGTVYAHPLYGYYVGWQSAAKTNKTSKSGYYSVTGESYTGAAATNYGKVYVTSYYDSDQTTPKFYKQPQLFPGNSAYTYFGNSYLGKEYGYIIQGATPTSPYYFGGGYWEADGS
jgi:hypothetical protein